MKFCCIFVETMTTKKSATSKPQKIRYTKLLGAKTTEHIYDSILAKALNLGIKLEDYLRREFERMASEDDARLGGEG